MLICFIMGQNFQPGDFLVFQLESGFAVLRVLAVHGEGLDKTWHISAYNEMFPDVESAEVACANPLGLTVSNSHIALTNRAFESTQVARISNTPLTFDERSPFLQWESDDSRSVLDRSVRLVLGLR